MALDQAKIGLKVISYADVDTGREELPFEVPNSRRCTGKASTTNLFCARPQTSNRIAAR